MGRMSSTEDGDRASGKVRRVETRGWTEEDSRDDYTEGPVRKDHECVDDTIVWDEV
jgi:hypothetical protein